MNCWDLEREATGTALSTSNGNGEDVVGSAGQCGEANSGHGQSTQRGVTGQSRMSLSPVGASPRASQH